MKRLLFPLFVLVALGLPAKAVTTFTLFPTNSIWGFQRGTSEASSPVSAWRSNAFNAASFVPAPAPFWYDTTGDSSTLSGGTQLTDMQNNYSCIFLRREFVVTNLAEIATLRLGALVDDGFVAWVNGAEVLRVNMVDQTPNAPITIATLASNYPEPVPFLYYDFPYPPAYLLPGTNLLAIQVFNTSLGSSDLDFNAELLAVLADTNPPVILSVSPARGSTVTNLTQVTVTFSEPVSGLDSDDFLIDGFPADSVSGSGTNFTFTFAQPPYGPVQIGWRATNGITDLAIPPNSFDYTAPGANWLYTLVDVVPPTVTLLYPPVGATVQSLAQIEVTFSEDVFNVDAADLLINGQPATNVTHAPGGPFVFRFSPAVAGAVSVAWAAGHGIVDLAVAPNPFAGGAWSYTVNPSAVTGDLIINEFLARNETGLVDEDGERQSWIEIYNRGGTTVNLANWALSDDASLPGLWSFPARAMAPGEYLVVFASGKDRKSPAGTSRFHTNFKLNGNGEHLGLYSPDSPRALVHGFNPVYPEQRNDHSYGYDTNGALRYFATPTPGAPNGVSTVVGVAEPVHFGVSRGFFTQPFNLTLTCATPGAQIRYTTDGREPTELTGTRYVQSLRLASNTVLRAAAFRASFLPSVSVTHTYLFNATAAIKSLPVISLVTASNNLYGPSGIVGISGGSYDGSGAWFPLTTNDYHNTDKHGVAWERPLSIELIQPADNSGFQVNGGIRAHGSDYTRPRYRPTDKFAYRVYFRGAYGPGKLNYPFFPGSAVQKFDQIILRAGHNDVNPFIRDEMTRRLHGNLGAVNIHGNLVNLFINGQYIGFFNPTERPDENWIQSWYQSAKNWDVIKQFSSVVDGDLVEYNSLNSYIRNSDVTAPAVYQEVARRFDLTNFVDYLCLNVYEDMGDWPANNWVMGRERSTNGVWRYYVWDGEWGCGIYGRAVTRNTFTMSGGGPDDSGLASVGSADIARYYQKLYTSPEFRLLFADRIHRNFFNNGALTDTNISLMHTDLRQQMLPVLPGYDNSIATTWIPQRRAIMMGFYNLYGLIASSNAPVFNQFGGRVPRGFNLTMAATNGGGTIYFTTNGGDPRVMFTGAVASNAVAYSGPVALGQTAVVRARTLNGTNWSAVTEAGFDVASLGVPLRITEIMYNPIGGSLYEFLELQNVGTTPLDLSGMYFEGVTFTFPPNSSLAAGARLVLGSNTDPNSFALRYPGVTVFGLFAGNLDNGGEKITLRDRFGNAIVSVDYDDENGWPTAADGSGYSLEIIDPLGDPDDPANWQASAAINGTPGAANSAPASSAVRLNEVMAENLTAVNNGGTYPDWVELYNSGAGPVDLGGWSLADGGNPRKFVFPANTILNGNGYLVVWCDSTTNTTPGLHAGFSLARNGESVFLYDSQTNRRDALTFGVQLADYSVGRVGGSWQLTTPTPNTANVAVTLGAATNLALNEWMANSLPGQDDYIELFNRSATDPVSLRGLYLGTSNALFQLTSLSFIAPRGYVLLHADENVGANHLDFKLPSGPNVIVLYDDAATEVQRVNYAAQAPGVSQGRLPDGAASVVSFPGSASPGAANYVNTYAGPVLNEVLARNRAATNADFVELFNPNATNFPLAGMSLSVDQAQPGQWSFPPGASVPASGYLLIWCDGARAASTNSGDYNTGRSLNAESGGAYLFNGVGQVVNFVEYGFQVSDLSIGLSAGQWRLLAAPTPGAANSAAAALATNGLLRLNEWMAAPASGSDWFEIHNPTNKPVDLGGLYLTDDPSAAGQVKFRVAPLSFIGPSGFVKFVADSDAGQGRNHVNFDVDKDGESLHIVATNGTNFIDSIVFGAQQRGVSEGRLPDGATGIAAFPGSATPAESNYRLAADVVMNELLSHTDPPVEDAVELYNPTSDAAVIGGWYLSNTQTDFKKYRVPDGTVVPPHGYLVIYENAFSNGGPASFTFNSAHGDEVWLSAADAMGNLTGVRAGAKFGAAFPGVSFGRVVTSVGVDFFAQAARTLNGSNASPKVGPVLINEIMYHPPDAPAGQPDGEYLELHNAGTNAAPLFDPNYPANRWRLAGGVNFTFPAGVTLAAGGHLLVVNFDPANAADLTAFRARYGVGAGVPIYGPYAGKLDNAGDDVELRAPDTPQQPPQPDAGFVPSVLVDRVQYSDSGPWPSGAVDGGGLSLQRRGPTLYGNDPVNWFAASPTPGAANGPPIVPPPVVTQSPQSQAIFQDGTASFQILASGAGPLSYQWRFNGIAIRDATNSSLVVNYLQLENSGTYDAFVSNPGGTAFSAPASLIVNVPPAIVQGPIDQSPRGGTNLTLSVLATGTPPLRYQWRLNGLALAGGTNATLPLNNVGLAQTGNYTVSVTNLFGATNASAFVNVLVNPLVLSPTTPLNLTAVAGETVTFSITVTGTLPMGYRWRRSGANVTNLVLNSSSCFLTIPNVQPLNAGLYTVIMTNAAFFTPGIITTNAILTVLADTDGDRIPDDWEIAHGTNPNVSDADDDPDHDGLTNYQEYIAGTDPQDAMSNLRVGLDLTGGVSVRFTARANKTYTVLFKDSLSDPSWQRLADVIAQAADHTEVVIDPGGSPARYYRLVTPRQP